MNIEKIFKAIFTAQKITGMTIVAAIVAGIVYLFSEKLGIVNSEDIVGTLLLAFLVTFLIIAVGAFILVNQKLKYDHLREIEKQKTEIAKVEGNGNSTTQTEGNNKAEVKGDKNTTVQGDDGKNTAKVTGEGNTTVQGLKGGSNITINNSEGTKIGQQNINSDVKNHKPTFN